MSDTSPAFPYGQRPAARRIAQVNHGPRIPGDLASMNHLVAGYDAATAGLGDCSSPEDKPEPRPVTVHCPLCDGSGERVDPRDLGMHPHDPDLRMVICPACTGDEVVTIPEARGIARRYGIQCLDLAPQSRARIDTAHGCGPRTT